MVIGFVALGLMLFYMAAVPVKLALVFQMDDALHFGVGASAFADGPALRGADARAQGRKKRRLHRRKALHLAFARLIPAALAASRSILKHISIDALNVRGCICARDARDTALLCGCAYALCGLLECRAPADAHVDLQADFSGAHLEILLECIVSIRAGHIICAALTGAIHYAGGKHG